MNASGGGKCKVTGNLKRGRVMSFRDAYLGGLLFDISENEKETLEG